VSMSQSKSTARDSFIDEVNILKNLRHPNIIQTLGFYSSSDNTVHYLLMEYMSRGDLFNLLHVKNDADVSWQNKGKDIALQVCAGLIYLHGLNPPLIHRDIKSPNILMNGDQAKISDVGISKFKDIKNKLNPANTLHFRRTCQYAAPEVLRAEPFDERSDIYSLGVLIWEIYVCRIPWYSYDDTEGYSDVKIQLAVGSGGERLKIPSDCPSNLRDLLNDCWAEAPSKRPTAIKIHERLSAIADGKINQSM